jgi:GNAT superfamily N-acetyltransferase
MKLGEETDIVDLIVRVFHEFVAPQYSREGVTEFRKFVRAEDLADRFKAGNPIILAQSEGKIVGAIEMRENSHIALLFVEKSHQQNGIAKELCRRAIEVCRKRNQNLQRITVNSSPNASSAYQKIGFICVGNEKTVNGIRFFPMELLLENYDNSQSVNSANPKKPDYPDVRGS